MGFTFSAEIENGAENETSLLAPNWNENENSQAFLAENETKYFNNNVYQGHTDCKKDKLSTSQSNCQWYKWCWNI